MHLGARLAALMLDPRGRISRQDLLVAATALLVLDLGLAEQMEGLPFYGLKVLAYWIGSVGVIKRLHDVGRSGWWLLWGFGALCIWSAVLGVGIALTIGFESLQPGGLGYIALLAALMLPALGLTLWLHLAPGDPQVNPYGPVPPGLITAGPVREGTRTVEQA